MDAHKQELSDVKKARIGSKIVSGLLILGSLAGIGFVESWSLAGLLFAFAWGLRVDQTADTFLAKEPAILQSGETVLSRELASKLRDVIPPRQ